MLLPLKSEIWDSIIQNQDIFEKTAIWIELLTDQISLRQFFKYFLLIFGVTFIVASYYSFPKLQHLVLEKL